METKKPKFQKEPLSIQKVGFKNSCERLKHKPHCRARRCPIASVQHSGHGHDFNDCKRVDTVGLSKFMEGWKRRLRCQAWPVTSPGFSPVTDKWCWFKWNWRRYPQLFRKSISLSIPIWRRRNKRNPAKSCWHHRTYQVGSDLPQQAFSDTWDISICRFWHPAA